MWWPLKAARSNVEGAFQLNGGQVRLAGEAVSTHCLCPSGSRNWGVGGRGGGKGVPPCLQRALAVAAEEADIIEGRVIPQGPTWRLLLRLDATQPFLALGAPLAILPPVQAMTIQGLSSRASKAGVGGPHVILNFASLLFHPQGKSHQKLARGAPEGLCPAPPPAVRERVCVSDSPQNSSLYHETVSLAPGRV